MSPPPFSLARRAHFRQTQRMTIDGENIRGDARVTWSELAGGEVTDELLRAVCGAYAIVASADGHVADDEVATFLGMVRQDERFPFINPRRLEDVFRELTAAILEDGVKGRALAFGAIEKFKGDAECSTIIIGAAQMSIVADGVLEEVEEAVLAQICWALGVDPAGY